jgi:anaerobic magnesium-protoporphyrin IX monomethyl ester cyclase
MKTLLINPPRENEIVGNNPTIIEEERGYNPPLGILYIAAYVEEQTAHEVAVIDAQVEELSYDALAKRISDYSPDVVGISAMTLCLFDVMKTIKTVREVSPGAKIVLGGPHVHLYPDETIELKGVDYLILGEGEVSFVMLLDALEGKIPFSKVKGLVYREDGRVVKTGMSELVADLDIFPHPARHLVPYEKYTSILSELNPITTMFTSRGCPYKCTFCDRPHLGKRFRARSARSVVDEFIKCKEMGIKFVLIYDDTFTVNKRRVMETCALLIKENVGLKFDIRARVDTMNTEMLKVLKEAGCTGIHYGVESGTDRILDVLDKSINLKLVRSVFDETMGMGMKTLGYFMIGCPTETRAEMDETIDFACRLKADYVHMTVLTPFPGTKIYEMALSEGVIESDVWREFAANPSADFVPPIYAGIYNREELMAILMQGYKKFYTRPGYIFNKLLELRSAKQFKKYVRAGLKVINPDKSNLPASSKH